MPYVTLSTEVLDTIRALAGPFAESYLSETLLPDLARAAGAQTSSIEAVRKSMDDPFRGLCTIFGHYAFSRRGKERYDLAEMSVAALHRVANRANFESFLTLPDASTLWAAYLEIASEWGRKPMEQLNRGLVAGLAELAQEVYRLDGVGSIPRWIAQAVEETRRVEPEFLRIVDLRGVGPKLTAVLIRDVVFLNDLEDSIENTDRLYLQPIDKWVRLISPWVVDEDGVEDAADWILAGKLSKYSRLAGVSGIRLNMGMTQFGMRHIRCAENLSRAMDQLAEC